MHSFLKHAQENAVDLDLSNDDLVGFFNSVPQDRMVSSVALLLEQYCENHGTALCDLKFQVDLQSKSTKDRVHVGVVRPVVVLGGDGWCVRML